MTEHLTLFSEVVNGLVWSIATRQSETFSVSFFFFSEKLKIQLTPDLEFLTLF